MKLRDYQKAASDAAINFLSSKDKYNGIIVIPTGGGKSLILADIASKLDAPVVIFQPSKEILEQNFSKMMAINPFGCAIFSASFNHKDIGKVTFATIGSAKSHAEDFKAFKYVIVDECQYCDPRKGMYKDFFEAIGDAKILGLTATPYRLSSSSYGSMLKFLTRTRPRIFDKVIYQVQVSTLLDMGFLAKLRYFQMSIVGWNDDNLKINSTGADFTDKSVKAEYKRIDFYGFLVDTIKRLLNPCKGRQPHGILVFTRFIEEAQRLTDEIDGCQIVSGTTPKSEREQILKSFKKGTTKVVANVGVLTCGFDYPELDTVVMARPTMSLAMYYQIVGRGIRPCKDKEGWYIDLCGNINRFGKVDDLKLVHGDHDKWAVFSGNKQLTNVLF